MRRIFCLTRLRLWRQSFILRALKACLVGWSVRQALWGVPVTVSKFLFWQTGVTLSLGLFFLCWQGTLPAVSALFGGGAVVLSNTGLAQRLFAFFGARAAKEMVKGLYQALLLKYLLMIVGLAILFTSVPIQASAFFSAMFCVQLSAFMAFYFC